MKKKHINLIITITTLSLLGTVFTQLYWVQKAVDLKDEQLNTSVRMALKSVATQLLDYHADSTLRQIKEFGPECIVEKTNITDLINGAFLDSLMQEEMGCMKIKQDYEYAVINMLNDRFVMGNYVHYKEELLKSPHRVSLKPLYKAGEYWLITYFPYQRSMILSQMIVWVILSAVFLIVVIVTFGLTISSFIRQKKLSEMKSDFVNNMTHEFKTPISTISLASEMLLKPNVYKSSDRTKKYAHVIFDENTRLQNQVERVLQIAILDKGETRIRKKEIDIHKIISKIVANFNLVVSKRGGKVLFKPDATNHIIFADKVHFSSIIANLIDNASKYTPENPGITVSTKDHKEGVVISVEDNGIGISPENQKQIFKKLYRVPTGNLHDVKGFGLGLYYVKTMVEAHEGFIKLHSEFGKGSRFEVYLPISNQTKMAHEEEQD